MDRCQDHEMFRQALADIKADLKEMSNKQDKIMEMLGNYSTEVSAIKWQLGLIRWVSLAFLTPVLGAISVAFWRLIK